MFNMPARSTLTQRLDHTDNASHCAQRHRQTDRRTDGQIDAGWCQWRALKTINAVILHLARLLLGWVTVSWQVNHLGTCTYTQPR